MSKHFTLFTDTDREGFISKRYDLNDVDAFESENDAISFSQSIEICEDVEGLSSVKAKYILIGIPEDVGVRANMGRVGASEAWEVFLKSFLGMQQTSLNDASRFCVLGNVFTEDIMQQAERLNSSVHKERKQLSDLVSLLDQRVSEIATKIMEAGKLPIVIGGGHNNSYPLLRSCGYSEPIDCINIDAHTDLRASKGRHSGNGFNHAIHDGYLKSYYILGIQENYLSQPMLDLIDSNLNINYSPHGSINGLADSAAQVALQHIDSTSFSLELDMDVVANFPSSAQSPVGYTFQEVRSLMREIIKQASSFPKYIHICEAAPKYGYENEVGKALAALVNDLP
ncbi:MAG: formimidoylglutamase [Nonlabens sp.]|uniref:formimidoylglutamase n=1 Tax=Nonlabens sp. TaxID=1888209 RepID=UPI0032197C8E